MHLRRFSNLISVAGLLACGLANAADDSRLSDVVMPYLADDELTERAAPLLELGDPFLDTGNLHPGFTLPGGAIWQPRLWVYGGGRTSVQSWQTTSGVDHSEWVNRLDLYANLQLTGTERLVVGIQPLHSDGEYTGRSFEPSHKVEAYNDDIHTLFFEGDFGELFPWLDPDDSSSNDIGFSVGRQQLFFQDGMLINDQLDSFGITRNTARFTSLHWLANLRLSAVFAWDDVHRADNHENKDSKLAGLFVQWDTIYSTVNTDLVYVRGDDVLKDDLWVLGIDGTQRIGLVNTTFRVNASFAPDGHSVQSDDGVLLFTEVSWSPAYTDNHVYINAFLGIDNYRSAARDSSAGGPLGRTGILFAARGLGSIPSALSSRPDDTFGVAAGYQMFLKGIRRQLVIEAGGTHADADNGLGLGARFQQALGKRLLLLLDAYVADSSEHGEGYGMSAELLVKF